MSFLIEGEKIIKRFGQSRFVNIKYYILGAILICIPIIYNLYFSKMKLPFDVFYLNFIPPVIGLILILIAEIKKRLGNYYITNFRIISIKGSFKKTMDSCTYDKIVNVKIMQTFLQRILNMGTIDITTFQRTEILLESISNPTQIEKLIYDQMEKQKIQETYRPAQQPIESKKVYEKESQIPQQPQPQPVTSYYLQQNRPLLASERKALENESKGLPQQISTSQTISTEASQYQPQKKKRFKIF